MSYESQQHTPLWSPGLYAVGVPLFGQHVSFCCGRLTTVGGLVGVVSHHPVGLQALPCADAAGHWWAGLGHDAAEYRAPGVPRARAGPLVGRGRFWSVLWVWRKSDLFVVLVFVVCSLSKTLSFLARRSLEIERVPPDQFCVRLAEVSKHWSFEELTW